MSGIYIGEEESRRIYVGFKPVIGVYAGEKRIWPPYGRTQVVQYATAGTYSVEVPWWARVAEVVVLGGGGGGSGGDFISSAECWGGDGGKWSVAAFANLPSHFTVRVGSGGGKGSSGNAGAAGSPSTVTGPIHSVEGAGGAGGSGYGSAIGRSPGTVTHFENQFVGGAQAARTKDGNPPGGGGGAASGGPIGRTPAGNGAAGFVWIRFKSE